MGRSYPINCYNIFLVQVSFINQPGQDYFCNAVLNTELEISFQLGTGETRIPFQKNT